MRSLSSLALLACLASCNSILGVKDLTGGDDDGDAGPGDGGGNDGSGATATVRVLLVTPDIFEVDPDRDGTVMLYAGGVRLATVSYGVVTTALELPLETATLELRDEDNLVLATLPLTYDEAPGAGERATIVLLGNLTQADVTAPERARAVGFNEALFASGTQPIISVVHAIADRGEFGFISYAATYAGQPGVPMPIGDIGMASGGAQVPPDVELRLRLGQGVSGSPGTEEISFTVPAVGASAKLLMVVAGLQQSVAQDVDPGLALYVIPVDGAGMRIRADPAYFVANFLVDWVGDTLSLSDANTGAALSRTSDQRAVPMIFFLRPGESALVQLDGVPTPYSFSVPVAAEGTRSFIALTGYTAPTGGQPGVSNIQIDQLDGASGNDSTVALVQASPDPNEVDIIFRDLAGDASDRPFSRAAFGNVVIRVVPVTPDAEVRVHLPDETNPLGTVTCAVDGPRQITVLSGMRSGAPAPLSITNIAMRTWPWEINGAFGVQ